MTRHFLGLPAPAKLNLFLHVLGRRADGHHELQSVFVPTSLADSLDFMSRADGRIERDGDVIGEAPRDLALRAAQLLQQAASTPLGATITVRKRIPAGSGMGGGSSDAATTLLALNRLWSLDWPREKLLPLAVQLGADVSFFLGAGPAFVEGIGERSTALAPGALGGALWAAVVWPQVHVSTVEIFNDPNLTRSAKATIIADFSAALSRGEPIGTNDLQPVVQRRFPEVNAALEHLARSGAARMTGSGSAVFARFDSEAAAQAAVASSPPGCLAWTVRLLDAHPLAAW
jgi:4-diphosphocytidyl-2-C-methyl-D-erythritol kinase